jgi:VanZ family protein
LLGDLLFDRIYNRSFLGASELGGALHHIVYTAAEKGVHLCLFFGLGFAVSGLSYRIRQRPSPILTLAVCIVVSAGSEALQRLSPDRDPQLVDVAINISGSVLSIITQALLIRQA